MNENIQAIILAAGKSSRFNATRSKLLEKICGQEMILYLTKILSKLNIDTTIVLGHQKEIIENLIKTHQQEIKFAYQTEQLGTGHALLCSEPTWNKENILILNGDVPLINEEIINSLYNKHIEKNADITFVTAHNLDPSLNSYGKVIKDDKSIKIVESKDDITTDNDNCCINAGIYLAKTEFLKNTIHSLKKSSVTGEIYITELINTASQNNFNVETINAPFDLVRGINTLDELWAAEQIKRSELIKKWMKEGIRFVAAQNNHIDLNVLIGNSTYVGASVQLYGNTKVGKNCRIEAFSILENCEIEDNVTVRSHCIIKNSKVKKNSILGPFTYVNDNSVIDQDCELANFVKIKNSQIGSNSKINQHCYLNNCKVSSNVIINAGTVIKDNHISNVKDSFENNDFLSSMNKEKVYSSTAE